MKVKLFDKRKKYMMYRFANSPRNTESSPRKNRQNSIDYDFSPIVIRRKWSQANSLEDDRPIPTKD